MARIWCEWPSFDALEWKRKEQGKRGGGSKKGWRWKVTDDQVVAIHEMRAAGKKITQIARVTACRGRRSIGCWPPEAEELSRSLAGRGKLNAWVGFIQRHSEDQAMAKTRSADRQRYWREVIERQQASGQSIVGFCAKEGLSPASFHAWKRRLRRPQRETGRRVGEASPRSRADRQRSSGWRGKPGSPVAWRRRAAGSRL